MTHTHTNTHSKNSANIHSKIVFGLYGAGGFAREVMPFVTEYISIVTQANTEVTHQIYFVETSPKRFWRNLDQNFGWNKRLYL